MDKLTAEAALYWQKQESRLRQGFTVLGTQNMGKIYFERRGFPGITENNIEEFRAKWRFLGHSYVKLRQTHYSMSNDFADVLEQIIFKDIDNYLTKIRNFNEVEGSYIFFPSSDCINDISSTKDVNDSKFIDIFQQFDTEILDTRRISTRAFLVKDVFQLSGIFSHWIDDLKHVFNQEIDGLSPSFNAPHQIFTVETPLQTIVAPGEFTTLISVCIPIRGSSNNLPAAFAALPQNAPPGWRIEKADWGAPLLDHLTADKEITNSAEVHVAIEQALNERQAALFIGSLYELTVEAIKTVGEIYQVTATQGEYTHKIAVVRQRESLVALAVFAGSVYGGKLMLDGVRKVSSDLWAILIKLLNRKLFEEQASDPPRIIRTKSDDED